MPRSVFQLAAVLLLVGVGAQAADTTFTPSGPDLSGVRSAIKAKNYDAALAQLKVLAVKYDQPDVNSLMGFALRKTGDRATAMKYYVKALDAEPSHRGALEYQGELFVELGQIDKAKANLARLSQICPFGCEEKEDLKEAIEHAPKAK
jgi:tetratricopeptide (TPR) repeat protein